MAEKGLIFDIKTYRPEASRIRRNILGVRTSITQESGYVDEKSFIIAAGKSVPIDDLPLNMAILVYSNYPVNITGTPVGNVASVSFPAQKLFVLTNGMNSVTIENPNSNEVTVSVIRMSQTYAEYLESLRLVTFPAFTNITPLGFTVTTLANVVALNLAFDPLTNDQVSAPSTSAIDKFRICDAAGTADPNGTHIMYLDDNVTSINASGTLQLWVGELS